VASREWINAIKTWVEEVNPNFWVQMQRIQINSSVLANDLSAVYYLSAWAASPGGDDDGHWKGKGSGDLVGLSVAYNNWLRMGDGPIVDEFKDNKAYRAISDNLTGAQPPTKPVPAVPPLPLNHRAVIIRTLNIKETGDGMDGMLASIAGGKDPDYYAEISLIGQTFKEATQRNKRSFNPYWTTIKFVPLSAEIIEANYRLMEEDAPDNPDDEADVNPKNGKGERALNFNINFNTNILAGDVIGPLGSGNSYTMEGNEGGNKAKVTIAVIVKNLRPAPDCRTSRLPRSLCRAAVDGMLLPVTP
jgi:hypothetical protein